MLLKVNYFAVDKGKNFVKVFIEPEISFPACTRNSTFQMIFYTLFNAVCSAFTNSFTCLNNEENKKGSQCQFALKNHCKFRNGLMKIMEIFEHLTKSEEKVRNNRKCGNI